jgi:hypothetical protein
VGQTEHYRSVIAGLTDLPPIYIIPEPMNKITFTKSGHSLIAENYDEISDRETIPVLIFPNPAGDQVIVRISNTRGLMAAAVELTDITGRRLNFSTSLSYNKEITIKLNPYPKGLYIVKVTEGNTHKNMLICHK